jgi:hypothetical protein
MAGVKNPNSDSTLDRRPVARVGEQGVTINEIECRILELFPGASLDARRSLSMLFAILKQGTSVQKLQWFTLYDLDFIRERVEALRSRGLLFTGTLSTQHVLGQVPGSEDLIERITGQKVIAQTQTHRAPAGYDLEKHLKASPIAPPAPSAADTNRKEEPMNTAINGADDADGAQIGAETCRKSEDCYKPDRHTGRCVGQGRYVRGRQSKKAKAVKEPGVKASKPKPARNGHKLQPVGALTATQMTAANPGYFKIEFEDGEDTISREGHGREGFARALKSLYQEFAGGSNG